MLKVFELEPNKRGHVWETYVDSKEVDLFSYMRGEYHNGPRCIVCGYGFCHHCKGDIPGVSCPATVLVDNLAQFIDDMMCAAITDRELEYVFGLSHEYLDGYIRAMQDVLDKLKGENK